MPPYDTQVHAWFNTRLHGKSVFMTREGLQLTLEYHRPDTGPMRPEWEQFGYRMPYLDSVRDMNPRSITRGVSDSVPHALVVYASTIGMLLAGFLFLKPERRHWLCWRGLRRGSLRRVIPLGVGTAIIACGFGGLWVWALSIAGVKPPEQTYLSGLSLFQLLWVTPAVVILAPLGEEVLFRGAMFGRFSRAQKPITGAVVTSLLFALVHGIPLLIPVFFVYGILFCWLFRRTGDLLAPMSAHAMINLIACTALAVMKFRS
jgi:membrane protease YdiL (CAAX protease family)